jgi:hypothetical protein
MYEFPNLFTGPEDGYKYLDERFLDWFPQLFVGEDVSDVVHFHWPQLAVVPTLAVHLWLSLPALCIVLRRVLNWHRLGVGVAQWFFKDGKDHPLDAIGYVAAALVFAGAGAMRLGGVVH